MPFLFHRLEIPELILIEPVAFDDERGFFMETYKRSDFQANGITEPLVQVNHTHSIRGVLRGLHYQRRPRAQGKLVSVIRGEIFDVAVDIRGGSSTYGRWVGTTLSAANHRLLYVPIGFAHGFCVVSDEADVTYKVTGAEYTPAFEEGVRWNDPAIGISWPVEDPIVSAKDEQLPPLSEAKPDFTYEGTPK